MAKARPPLAYDVHPGVAMVQKWVAELPAKTGKSLEEWAVHLRRQAIPDLKDRRAYLKSEHGFGTNTAWWLAEYADGAPTWDADPGMYLQQAAGYVESQYGGAKAHFRPLFEVVARFVRSLGPDVKICPCKTIVPFYRKHVFAEVRPATRTRFELALALGETPFGERLACNPRAQGNDRLRHRIAMTEVKDFDAAAKKWLTKAYRADG